MATCLVVQHVAPERPFAIADALHRAGVRVRVVRAFAGEAVPTTAEELDGLVVMGGPMSAAGDEGFPTRRAELELLGAALAADVPVLGVCLGAQLLAAAAGAEVTAGTGPEVGWGPVDLSPAAADDPLLAGLPSSLTVLHWHGETFTLPEGAALLAGNDRYPHQAFRLGRAWGLQFHLEVVAAAVEAFTATFAADAATAPGGAAAIRAATVEALAELGPHRDRVLDRFAHLVAQALPAR